MSKRDEIFSNKLENITPFRFNDEVANAFDDMVERSIPNYNEIHKIIIDLVTRYYPGSGIVYDLGCSTGTTIQMLEKIFVEKNRFISFVGVDTSVPMLEKAKEKCEKVREVTFLAEDMSEVELKDAKVVILNYTLQFFQQEGRVEFLKKIYKSLSQGGILILSEKIKSKGTLMQDCITDLYYDFKRRNGYSELEISQKREALENVLVPITPEEQVEMLKVAGFQESEMLFRWYNFESFLAIKTKEDGV